MSSFTTKLFIILHNKKSVIIKHLSCFDQKEICSSHLNSLKCELQAVTFFNKLE